MKYQECTGLVYAGDPKLRPRPISRPGDVDQTNFMIGGIPILDLPAPKKHNRFSPRLAKAQSGR